MKRFYSVILAGLLLSFTWGSANAEKQDGSGKDDLVAAVYDATSLVDCHPEVQVDNGPWEARPWAPGTVMAAEILPRDLADQHPQSVIVELTGNEGTDAALIAKAVQALHDDVASQGITPAACSAHSKTIRGRYNIGDGYIVEYEMRYTVEPSCYVTDVWDRDRSTYNGARWLRSCSNGLYYNCHERDIPLSGTYASWWTVPDSYIGWQYTNQTERCSFLRCTTYYGYWYFD